MGEKAEVDTTAKMDGRRVANFIVVSFVSSASVVWGVCGAWKIFQDFCQWPDDVTVTHTNFHLQLANKLKFLWSAVYNSALINYLILLFHICLTSCTEVALFMHPLSPFTCSLGCKEKVDIFFQF